MSDENLLDIFTEQCERALQEKGVYPNQCVWQTECGEMVYVGMLDISPDDVIKFALNCLLCKGAKEIVFGLDRYVTNKEEQGLEHNDVLTVFHFDVEGWHYGVLEYQYEPRVWKDIDWDNDYWRDLMEAEIIRFFEGSILKLRGSEK